MRGLRAGLMLLLPLALAAGSSDVVPWPHQSPPTPSEIAALVDDATAVNDREQREEWLAAAEKGEESESLGVFQDAIDQGFYSLDFLFQKGDDIFAHEFTPEDGYARGPFTGFQRIHTGVRGGLDSFSCAGCHSVGGVDGAGATTQNAFLLGDGEHISSAVVRNAPPLQGLGIIQALAAEMTYSLQQARDQAISQAQTTNQPVSAPLTAKGISFGALTAHPDGSIDTSAVEGVDPDLVVKPFGWKGSISKLRRFAEEAARVHFGIQSHILALDNQQSPDPDRLGDGPWYDPDNDGKTRELEEGALTALAVYLAMQETPIVLPPFDPILQDKWANGKALFDSIGCPSCHTTSLTLVNTIWNETSDTTGHAVTLNLLTDGDEPRGTGQVTLFSDLKRHAMGDALADPHDGDPLIPRDVFLTRPLWGIAESGPYLHDGRAPTLPEAILAHGGEAQSARDAFDDLPAGEQADLHVFLLSLTRDPKVRIAR